MRATVNATWSDTEFPCIRSSARVLILGGPLDLPERARERLAELEAQWTRFRPTSELCRLNAADGAPVLLSRETLQIDLDSDLAPSRTFHLGEGAVATSTRLRRAWMQDGASGVCRWHCVSSRGRDPRGCSTSTGSSAA